MLVHIFKFWDVSLGVYSEYLPHTWASALVNISSGFANNKGAEQSAHPRRLISAFVNRFLESILSKVAISAISIF